MQSSTRRVIGIFVLALASYLTLAATAVFAGVDLDQCQNGVTTPPLQNLNKPCGQSNPDALPDPTWENGNINGSNSQYREGDGVPYRVIVDGLSDGVHSVQMEYDFTKGGKFAIDRLTRPSLTQMQNDCGTGGQSAFTNCVLHSFAPTDMPGEVSVVMATQPALPNSGNLIVAGKPRLLSGLELLEPRGQYYSICEMGIPEGWGALNWRVEITPYGSNKPQTIINYTPYLYGQLWQDPYGVVYNPDHFLTGIGVDLNNRCINMMIPQDADEVAIYANNVTQGGRMTGGGSVFTAEGKRVTHGFELHCDKNDKPNNLEINWDGGNRFHLENLTYANCTDDPAIDSPAPPAAGFDTYEGRGTGRYNGQPASAEWIFTDAGEPGLNDKVVKLRIKLGYGNGNGNPVLLVENANLNRGNHQAHK